MKTSLKRKTIKVRLFSDESRVKPFATLEIPDYETLPRIIIHGDVIYQQYRSSYSSLNQDYHATDLIHTATDDEFTPINPEPETKPEPAAVKTQATPEEATLAS